MSRPYILVEAYPGDLACEVTKRIEEGYVPVGGPIQGRKGISEHYLLQAMFNEQYVEIKRGPAGLKLPTAQELDEAVDEANTAHPGSASKGERTFVMASNGEPFAFSSIKEREKWDSDIESINAALENEAKFLALDEGAAEAILNAARRIFHRRITHLRQLQQEPYMQHLVPSNNADRWQILYEHTRIGEGVMEELYAGRRARDPYAKAHRPAITIDLVDAQRIDSILESSSAQYPTEHQEAVLRFKRAVHGTKES